MLTGRAELGACPLLAPINQHLVNDAATWTAALGLFTKHVFDICFDVRHLHLLSTELFGIS